MILFDPENLFPLLKLESYAYKEAQEHSLLVDKWIGFNVDEIEMKIRSQEKSQPGSVPQQNWQHLSAQAMQTPYVEIRNILDLLDIQAGDHIVDLGCAYARMAFIVGKHYPQVGFSGYELEELRIHEARRILRLHSFANIHLHVADLASADFQMPEAEIYFIFDYGSEPAVRKTLRDLQKTAKKKKIQVVARGKLVRFWIHKEHPWLAEVEPARHFPHFSIYNS